MKKLLLIIYLWTAAHCIMAQSGTFTNVKTRDGVTSLSTNTDLNLSGNGTGNVNITDELILSTFGIEVGEELLEVISTGLYKGGVLSINGGDNTKYDISALSGHVLDYHTDPDNPTYMSVSLATQTAVDLTGTARVNHILIDNAGAIVQQTTYPTREQRRDYLYLGRLIQNNGTGVIIQAQNTPMIVTQPVNQLYDLFDALGTFNFSGNVISFNGANMTFNKSVGSVFQAGANNVNNPADPHVVAVPGQTPQSFQYITQLSGSATGIDVTIIDPGVYDVGGVITAIAGANKQATIQRVYLFPSGNVRVQYGQIVYADLSTALQELEAEVYISNPDIGGNGVLIGFIIVTKGATVLNDPLTARFLKSSRFGEVGAGGSGQSVSTIQDVYDNSGDTPYTTLTSTGLGIGVRDNATPIGSDLFYVSNSDGASKYLSVTSSGVVLPTSTASTVVYSNASKVLTSLPDGTNGQVLTTNGAGALSWGATGNVTKVGTPVNNQIGVWTGDGTLEGDANFTWNATSLRVGSGTPSTFILTEGIRTSTSSFISELISRTSIPTGELNVPTLYFAPDVGQTAAREAGNIRATTGTGDDTGSIPVMILESDVSGAALSTRPTLAGYNYTTKQWEVGADGDWDYQGNEISNFSGLLSEVSSGSPYIILSNEVSTVSAPNIGISSDAIQLAAEVKGSANGGTTFGLTNAGLASIVATNLTGATSMLFGTGSSIPLHIGTNSTISATVSGSTQDWAFNTKNITGVNGLTAVTVTGTTSLSTPLISRTGTLNINATTGTTLQYNGVTQLTVGNGTVTNSGNAAITGNATITGATSSFNGAYTATAANPEIVNVITVANLAASGMYQCTVSTPTGSYLQNVIVVTTGLKAITILETFNSGASILTFVDSSGNLAIQKTTTAMPNVVYSILRTK